MIGIGVVMTIDCALTPADVREALALPQRWRDNVRGTLVAYAVALAIAVPTAAGTMGQEPPTVVAAAAAAPARDLWVTLAPSLLGVTLVAGATLVGRWRARRPRPGRWGVGGGLVAAAAFGWLALPLVPALAVQWHPTLHRTLFAAVAPWLAWRAFSAATTLAGPRQAAAVLWATHPSLRRPGTVQLDEDGVVLTDAVVEHRYRWPHVVRYRETAGLIVLVTEDGGLVMLPKRAVPNPADADVLRRLIAAHVPAGAFLPPDAAFPVVPMPTH